MGLGVDHVATADVAASIDAFGERYTDRVFTVFELAVADRLAPATRTQHLAGRFAAKEAVVKAIGYPGSAALPWTSIEVRNESTGAPFIVLNDDLTTWCAGAGIGDLEVSISHDASLAIAVALTRPGPRGRQSHPPLQAATHDEETT